MITVAGLGPGDLNRLPESVRMLLLDPDRTVVLRTEDHPAAAQLAALRPVVSCDDLYRAHDTFEEVYQAIVDRLVELSRKGPVIYAVPGNPLVGEFAVRMLLDSLEEVEVVPAESFVDAVLAEVGYDPLDRGLQILNGQRLPDPLVLAVPTIVGHLDRPEVLGDACAAVGRVVNEDTRVLVLVDLGTAEPRVVEALPGEVDPGLAGPRTSLFIDAAPGGLIGAVHVMRRLREECPWDREQTHHSLVKNLVEEAYELVEAISALDEEDPDWVGYAAVEDEVGDVLLQVLFHAGIARQAGAFDIDDAAEVMRRKLVRRHPHVFGDTEVGSAAEVKSNWDRIKAEEWGDAGERPIFEGVPEGMPALHRAAKIQNRAAKAGHDTGGVAETLAAVKVRLGEVEQTLETGPAEAFGELLFALVSLGRHLGVDPELALRRAIARFQSSSEG
jgi:tetrapyrrole methylase family protein/MazG family protein